MRLCLRLRAVARSLTESWCVVASFPPGARLGPPPAGAAAPARVHGSSMVWCLRTN